MGGVPEQRGALSGRRGEGADSPYVASEGAPFPDVLDITRLEPGGPEDNGGYFVQEGPLPFSSDYLRSAGGTTLHWLGTCLRMLPHDFEMASRYGVGRDWPLDYDDLDHFYERAERELGVAGDVADQEYLGVRFSPGYVYPMHRIPPATVTGASPPRSTGARCTSTARTSGRGDEHAAGPQLHAEPRIRRPQRLRAGGRGRPPPHRAALRGERQLHPDLPRAGEVQRAQDAAPGDRGPGRGPTQAVVSRVVLAPDRRRVRALEYIAYDDGALPAAPERVTADVYVLAANAIGTPSSC